MTMRIRRKTRSKTLKTVKEFFKSYFKFNYDKHNDLIDRSHMAIVLLVNNTGPV